MKVPGTHTFPLISRVSRVQAPSVLPQLRVQVPSPLRALRGPGHLARLFQRRGLESPLQVFRPRVRLALSRLLEHQMLFRQALRPRVRLARLFLRGQALSLSQALRGPGHLARLFQRRGLESPLQVFRPREESGNPMFGALLTDHRPQAGLLWIRHRPPLGLI